MTRYSQLWMDEKKRIGPLKTELSEVTRQRDIYREFIVQSGYRDEYLRWLGQKMGVDLWSDEDVANQQSTTQEGK